MADTSITEIICLDCGTATPAAEVGTYQSNRGKRYYHKRCRPCRNKKDRESNHKHGRVARPSSAYRVFVNPETGERMKRCTKCEVSRPIENFGYAAQKKDKLRPDCKICARARETKGRKRNSEKDKNQRRAWRAKNIDKVREISRRYYHNLTPEQRRERRKAAYEYLKAYKARHRAQKVTDTAEVVMRASIIQRDGMACYLCSRQLELSEVVLDHVHPLSRGGTHTEDNLRVACQTCNARKYNKLLSEITWPHFKH